MNMVNRDMVKILFECGCGLDDILPFVEWQKRGKIVKKGEKAMKIYVLLQCEQGELHFTKEHKLQVFCKCQTVDMPK